MQPTELLKKEHRIILGVLSALEAIASEAERLGSLDRDSAESVLDFLLEFADQSHHMKEEDVLFPAIVAAGLPGDHGPVAVMLHEHEEGRAHVRALREDLVGASAGDTTALQSFTERSRIFASLLREHIAKENDILFPLAESLIGTESRESILAAFAHADELRGEAVRARLLEMAQALEERYGPARGAPAPA